MKLLELLEIADKQKVSDLIWYHNNHLSKNTASREDIYEWYLEFLEDLKSLKPKLDEETYPKGVYYLEVFRHHYEESNKDDDYRYDDFYYDVCGKETLEEVPQEEMTTPLCADWEEWLAYDILERPIKESGAEIVATEIIWKMTFYGFTSEEHSKKLKDLWNGAEDDEKKISNVDILTEIVETDGFKVVPVKLSDGDTSYSIQDGEEPLLKVPQKLKNKIKKSVPNFSHFGMGDCVHLKKNGL